MQMRWVIINCLRTPLQWKYKRINFFVYLSTIWNPFYLLFYRMNSNFICILLSPVNKFNTKARLIFQQKTNFTGTDQTIYNEYTSIVGDRGIGLRGGFVAKILNQRCVLAAALRPATEVWIFPYLFLLLTDV